MKTPMNYRNIALSLTLGLFTFHLYIVGNLIVEKQTRGLASESVECAPFQSVEELEASEAECRFSYVFDDESEMYDVNVIYGTSSTSLNVSLDTLGLEEGATDAEIRAAILSGVRVNSGGAFSINYGDGTEVNLTGVAAEEEVEDPAPTAADEEEVAVELAAEPDTAPVDTEIAEEDVTLQTRLEELRGQVESLSQCLGENEGRAERLLSRADSYSRNRPEEAEEKLDELEELLADVDDNGDCEAEEEGEEVATELSAEDQAERFRQFALLRQRARASGAATGSIDGQTLAAMSELARTGGDEAGMRALAEIRAYEISSFIGATRGRIALQTNPERIAELEAQIVAADREFDQLMGDLGVVGTDAVNFWSNTISGASSDAVAGNVDQILQEGSQATIDPVTGNAGATATGPTSADLEALSQYLRQVRQMYQSSRAPVDATRNRTGENARAQSRQAAPDNRRLDFMTGQSGAVQ